MYEGKLLPFLLILLVYPHAQAGGMPVVSDQDIYEATKEICTQVSISDLKDPQKTKDLERGFYDSKKFARLDSPFNSLTR